MSRCHTLLVPLATAAQLSAGTAHAEARRAAQSLPVPARLAPPAPVKTGREEPARVQPARGGGERGGGERGRFDNRRYDNDRDDYERAKEREGRKIDRHHGRDDSPGC
jgi:hypothetical protein